MKARSLRSLDLNSPSAHFLLPLTFAFLPEVRVYRPISKTQGRNSQSLSDRNSMATGNVFFKFHTPLTPARHSCAPTRFLSWDLRDYSSHPLYEELNSTGRAAMKNAALPRNQPLFPGAQLPP